MPDTDRELLQAAARAAGIEGAYFESDNPIHRGIYQARGEYYWNPLISDSEALRLAVKLDIDIEFHSGCAVAWSNDRFEERFGSDPMAATRRAIVRAAASIAPTAGTSMADGER